MLRIESLIVTAIISIILQGIFAFLTWKWNISATFKKRTITKDKVPAIMRDLYIFTIILCVVTAIFNFRKVDMNLDYEINTELKLEGIYRNSSDYQEQKELVTKEVKKGLYTYLAVLEVGLFVVYIGVIPLQKKMILENSIDE